MADAFPSPCPICAAPRREVGTRVFLSVHTAALDFCAACGFLQVRQPHWLAQAYEHAITSLDTGLVARNLRIAATLEGLLPILGSARGPYLDQGGGIGLLVRLMRDRGFDFRWADAHAQNVLTRGFELAPGENCVAVTAIEVLEHLADPLDFVAHALAQAGSRTLIFTTELYAGEPPADWWYYSEATGQHIAFYRRDTLVAIGSHFGLSLYSHGGLHMLTDRPLGRLAFRWRVGRLGRLLARTRRRSSLIQADYDTLLARLRSGSEPDRGASNSSPACPGEGREGGGPPRTRSGVVEGHRRWSALVEPCASPPVPLHHPAGGPPPRAGEEL